MKFNNLPTLLLVTATTDGGIGARTMFWIRPTLQLKMLMVKSFILWKLRVTFKNT